MIVAGSLTLATVIETAWSVTLNANDSGTSWAGYTSRVVPTALNGSGGPWTKIRMRFVASTVDAMSILHASVGIQSSAGATTATPKQLLFGGLSGFNLTAGQTITSDWAVFSFALTDKLVLIKDYGAGTLQPRILSGGATEYYKSGTQTWNVANPSGLSNQAFVSGVNLVEGMQ